MSGSAERLPETLHDNHRMKIDTNPILVRKEAGQSNNAKILAGVIGGLGLTIGVSSLGIEAFDSGQTTDGVKAEWTSAMAQRQSAYVVTVDGMSKISSLATNNATLGQLKYHCYYQSKDPNCYDTVVWNASRALSTQDASIPGYPPSNLNSTPGEYNLEPGAVRHSTRWVW